MLWHFQATFSQITWKEWHHCPNPPSPWGRYAREQQWCLGLEMISWYQLLAPWRNITICLQCNAFKCNEMQHYITMHYITMHYIAQCALQCNVNDQIALYFKHRDGGIWLPRGISPYTALKIKLCWTPMYYIAHRSNWIVFQTLHCRDGDIWLPRGISRPS